MKLACQRCAAAYTVADSKIAGKQTFRWRCRRCGEDIVVRRDEHGAAAIEPVRVSLPTEIAPDSNSVMFSLSMLQARAEPPRLAVTKPRDAIDAILTVGNVPASPLVAPSLPLVQTAAPRAGSSRVNRTVILASIAAAVIVANGGIAIAMLLRPAAAPLPSTVLRAASPTIERTTHAEPVLSSPTIAASPVAGAPIENAPATVARVHPRSADTTLTTQRPIEARTVPPSTPAHATNCASLCHGDTPCLMQCSVQPTATANARTSPVTIANPTTTETELPAAPQRSDVYRALDSVRSSVSACGHGHAGTASVTVTFAGSGRVTTANVEGPYAGTAEGSCMATAMRQASIPPFARSSFMVTFPYAIR